jgi:hypothetical protein
VARNEEATVIVKGLPNTEYSITVIYKSGESVAEGLENKISNSDGTISWTWKIGSRTTHMTHHLIVSDGENSLRVEFVVE